jgi:CheY-like chemotaxis protein
MSDLRILIVEDDSRWSEVIAGLLAPMAGHAGGTHVAQDHDHAVALVQRIRFDLVTVDLGLPNALPINKSDTAQGFQLLKELRSCTLNETAAVLVVSGRMKSNQVSEAMQQYKVHHFFEKDDFDDVHFLSKATDALLLARIKRANKKSDRRSRLRIVFDKASILGSELAGPSRRAYYPATSAPKLDVADFVRRANNMNLLVNEGPSAWRPEARALGTSLYEILSHDRRIVEGLSAASNPTNLWLQFSGPAEGLGVPFELLHDGEEYLAFKHILTREVESPRNSIKMANFQTFIRSFLGGHVPLRILIVGIDDDSGAYTIQQEAESLEGVISNAIRCLGIRTQIELLVGHEATRWRLSEALQHGGYHLFHYSGHGYHASDQPEVSGILTAEDDGQFSSLTASDLANLCRGTELRFAYLSCCLGACSSPVIKHGDFFGLFDALARADVPMVLGYRWEVGDVSAFSLAKAFYEKLWRTLSPGEALLEARNEISQHGTRRDNETWASPVLMTQNA